jgi:hypothetical protein
LFHFIKPATPLLSKYRQPFSKYCQPLLKYCQPFSKNGQDCLNEFRYSEGVEFVSRLKHEEKWALLPKPHLPAISIIGISFLLKSVLDFSTRTSIKYSIGDMPVSFLNALFKLEGEMCVNSASCFTVKPS